MDWAGIAKKVIAAGAPTIGRALAGPIGGMAGELLAKMLGVEPTPEAVAEAVEERSTEEMVSFDQQGTAKLDAIMRVWEADINAERDIAIANNKEVNETIRATAQGDGLLGKWRGVHAWELTLECFFSFILFWFCLIFRPSSIQIIIEANAMISIYLSARFGVLGVHVFQGSKERQTSLKELAQTVTNQPPLR